MGCDIHLTVEHRVNGVWINDDLTHDVDEYGNTNVHNRPAYDDRVYSGRNYDLFSILADVRNGYGFAGVDTGEGFKPIAAPKGVPDDASAIYREWVEQWSGDGHSHSYFTVADLMTYDWTQVTTKRGIVGYHELARWKMFGVPEKWCGGVSGDGITHHDGAEAITVIDRLLPDSDWWTLYHGFTHDVGADKPVSLDNVRGRLPGETYLALEQAFGAKPVFNVSWKRPYYHVAREFLGETLPKLWQLGAPEDVRILFFFDN